jgi:hypothetical protein
MGEAGEEYFGFLVFGEVSMELLGVAEGRCVALVMDRVLPVVAGRLVGCSSSLRRGGTGMMGFAVLLAGGVNQRGDHANRWWGS